MPECQRPPVMALSGLREAIKGEVVVDLKTYLRQVVQPATAADLGGAEISRRLAR